MLFAAIYVPDFIAAAVLRIAPELRSRPLVVLEGTAPLVRVCGMNQVARRAGIDLGITQMQAEALPGVVLRRRSPAPEQAAWAALLDCAHAFSPRIEPLPPLPSGGVLLDVSGLERLFGPPTSIARELRRRAGELGLETNVAVAANREAAICAAHGFAGITVIPPGEEAQRLGPLPVEVLVSSFEFQVASGCESKTTRNWKLETGNFLETLSRWGVRTFRALAALPPVAVAERLGQQGVRWQKLARGEGSQQLNAAEPPLVFAEAIELEHPLETLEPLLFVFSRLLESLCARLESRSLAAAELRLTLTLDGALRDEESAHRPIGSSVHQPIATEDVPTNARSSDHRIIRSSDSFVRALRLAAPLRDARVLLKLLQLDLQAHPPGAPVLKVALALQPAPPPSAQQGLFAPVAPDPARLQVLLARLAGVVGQGRVGSAELLDTHRPDAFRVQRFVAVELSDCGIAKLHNCGIAPSSPDGFSVNSSVRECSNSAIGQIRLALRMFRPPRPARVEVRAGRPISLAVEPPARAGFARDGVEEPPIAGAIVWCAGPWRSAGEWWQDDGTPEEHRAIGSSSHRAIENRLIGSSAHRLIGDARPAARPKRLQTPPAREVNPTGYVYPPPCAPPTPGKTSAQAAEARAAAGEHSGFSRDEWDVAIRSGEQTVLCRLVHEQGQHGWFLEGIYD